MEVAAGEIAGRDRLLALGLGVVGAGEIGRAADQLRQRRDQRVEHHARGLPRRDLRRLGGEFGADAGDAPYRSPAAARRRCAARNRARIAAGAAPSRCCQAAEAAAPRAPTARHHSATSPGMTKGGSRQPSRSRAPAISAAPSAAPWAPAEPALVGAPKAITVRQAMSEGRSVSRARASAAATASGSWPSTRDAVPAGGGEALQADPRRWKARCRRRSRWGCRPTARSAC